MSQTCLVFIETHIHLRVYAESDNVRTCAARPAATVGGSEARPSAAVPGKVLELLIVWYEAGFQLV